MTNHQSSFQIIGISIRTNNQQASNDLGKLWSKFIGENTSRKILNKISEDIYSVYTDYQSDHSGDYTTIIGYQVDSLENIHEGLIGKEVPASNYRKFLAKGKFPDCVQATWATIWNSEINRSYVADFEVYGSKSMNMSDAEVEIFISVK
jgi:predicted transcriptional regulator YdeE